MALLKEAGYPDGFRLTLHGPNDRYVNDAKIVQAVAQMFTRIGVETTVDVMPWSVYANKSGRFQRLPVLLGRQHRGDLEPALGDLRHARTRPPASASPTKPATPTRRSTRKLKQALRTLDDAARNKLLAEASSIAFHDAAILPLHFEVSVWGAKRELTYATRADQYTLAMGVKRT